LDAMDLDTLYPRHAEKRVVEALADTPAALIHGPQRGGGGVHLMTIQSEMAAPGV
jgi:hypothetical protein